MEQRSSSTFELEFEQPVDHQSPDGPAFGQRVFLHHVDEDRPLVLVTQGYAGNRPTSEPQQLLGANQLVVEHRFFGESLPPQSPTPWEFLTIEQSSGDLHRIVSALAPLYPEPWISTGVSKGGMTAIFHRRFYPDDVAGTVAYVAPITLGREDQRYLDFFEQARSADCRAQIHGLQRTALLRRTEVLELYRTTHVEAAFDIIGGAEAAYESTVTQMEWRLPISSSCDVPNEPLTDEELLELLLTLGFESSRNDDYLESLGPYYYQVENQLSGGITPTDHLNDLLDFAWEGYFERLFPGVDKPTFDPSAMQDIVDWIHGDAENMIFLYGTHDPFFAARVGLDGDDEARDLHELLVSSGGHGSSLRDLPTEEQEQACTWLTHWSGTSLNECKVALLFPTVASRHSAHEPPPPLRRP